MLVVETIGKIRRWHFQDGKPIKEICRELGVLRKTVRKVGADHARAVNPTRGGAVYAPNELDDAFERGLAGASRRGLAEIFGSNGNELAKLYRFMDGGCVGPERD